MSNIQADAKKAAAELLTRVKASGFDAEASKDARLADMKAKQSAWEEELDGYTFNAPHAPDGKIKPRMALRELEKVMLEEDLTPTPTLTLTLI